MTEIPSLEALLVDRLAERVVERFHAELVPIVVAAVRAAVAEQERPWLSRADAARRLGCSVDTIDRSIRACEIEVQRIGSRGIRVRLPAAPASEIEVAALARAARGEG